MEQNPTQSPELTREGDRSDARFERELNHRIRNMMQMVLGLAHHTARTCTDFACFERAFAGRITALSRVYDLASEEKWDGVAMTDLAAQVLDVFPPAQGRLDLLSAHMTVPVETALTLAVVLHDLGDQAVRNGAWSVPDGRVALSWRTAEERASLVLIVCWLERGGPTPQTRGVEAITSHALSSVERPGPTTTDLHEGGVRTVVRIPCGELTSASHLQPS